MRTLLACGVAVAALVGAACGPAQSQTTETIAKPCDSTRGSTNPLKICVELSPPEVVVQQAAYAAPGCDRPGLFQRCCHFPHRQRAYAVSPMVAPYAPMMTAPMYSLAPAAPAMSFAPTFAPPAMSFAPTFAAPAMSFAPMAAPTFSLAQPTFSPAAPVFVLPTSPSPTAPSPQTPPPASPAATELNDVLKKLSLSIESLNKTARQQTKILEYHENRLDDLDARLEELTKKIKTATPDAPKKTSAAPALPLDPRAAITPGNRAGVTQITQPPKLLRSDEK